VLPESVVSRPSSVLDAARSTPPPSARLEREAFEGDSTNPLRVKFEALAEGKAGAPLGNSNNRSGLPNPIPDSPIPNDIRVWVPDETAAPEPPPQLTPKPRDRSREPQAGTSVGYAVRRLEREATKDPEGPAAAAFERLKAGESKSVRGEVQAAPVAACFFLTASLAPRPL
jgi:hypothetical protein